MRLIFLQFVEKYANVLRDYACVHVYKCIISESPILIFCASTRFDITRVLLAFIRRATLNEACTISSICFASSILSVERTMSSANQSFAIHINPSVLSRFRFNCVIKANCEKFRRNRVTLSNSST